MCTYRERPDFQLFQNWNHFNYSQCILELKDDRKIDDLARLSFRKGSLLSSLPIDFINFPKAFLSPKLASLGASDMLPVRTQRLMSVMCPRSYWFKMLSASISNHFLSTSYF